VSDCGFYLPIGATLVIGSETMAGAEAWERMRASFGQNLVLSLDFDEEGLRGPTEMMTAPATWPERLIMMCLGRVGTEIGPDLRRLREVAALAGGRTIYAAGGISSLDDVSAVKDDGAGGALVATALHSGAINQKEIAALVGEQRSQR
jgi:uncharacterized protein related to proFAR isomerase